MKKEMVLSWNQTLHFLNSLKKEFAESGGPTLLYLGCLREMDLSGDDGQPRGMTFGSMAGKAWWKTCGGKVVTLERTSEAFVEPVIILTVEERPERWEMLGKQFGCFCKTAIKLAENSSDESYPTRSDPGYF
jgi:hypothetical protein